MEITVRAEDWHKVSQDLRAYDPALLRGLRKSLREAAQAGVDGVREMLGMSSPDGGPDEGTNRSALAAATRASVSFAKRGGSVRVVTSPSRLAPEHRAILAAYNMKRFRHPVFGTDTWQDQSGRPYFYGPIMKAGHRDMRAGVEAAMEDAVRAIGARGA